MEGIRRALLLGLVLIAGTAIEHAPSVSPRPMLDHVCNISYCNYCSKTVKPDHQCFIEVKKRVNVKSWRYVFDDFECTQITLDTETKQPVHEVNYCIAMSICDKSPDGNRLIIVFQFIYSVDQVVKIL